MSFMEAEKPRCKNRHGTVSVRIEPREKSLGEFSVRRVLPATERRMVGPFVFFDHIGPAEFPPGAGIQVRPHPHIGLATITYLFEGEIVHRDSLGIVQPIRAGAVNLMTAGKGIVHSERAGDDLDSQSKLHGIQSWMALPDEHEECEPDFRHYAADTLPDFDVVDVNVRVIIGKAYGHESPVKTLSNMLYLECRMPRGSQLDLPDDSAELAVYVVDGDISIDGESYAGGVMAVVNAGKKVQLQAIEDSRVMVIGGDSPGKRTVWWNFVSGSKERIEQAKDDWREGRFGTVPGDDEFIPLPEK